MEFMEINLKNLIKSALIILLLNIFFVGRISAQVTSDIPNAVYLNPSYIQELEQKTNCELNGAWSTEYAYYWLADPANSQANLPSYIKNITYTGVVQESNSTSISTPEISSSNGGRNKYYLSSSLDGETLAITVDLENPDNFISWLPLNLYFDPSLIKNPEEQIKLKLSYADSALGDIVYIQNTKFNGGCYLNLLVKSPDPHSKGKLTIELNPADDSKAAISGIFWSEPRKESDLQITYTGANKVSAQTWYQNLRTDSGAVIWSPKSNEDSNDNSLVKIGIGKVTYTTSTGYEFPTVLKNKGSYNFKVLQGIAGPKGINGLEFYLNPDSSVCSNGCDIGLYSTESYKQNVFIYSAEKDRKNKLAAKTETFGDGKPAFQNFHVEPDSNVQLRIRLTTNDLINPPILRGFYILPAKSDSTISDSEGVVLNIDNVQNTGPQIQPIIPIIPIVPVIQIPQVISFTNDIPAIKPATVQVVTNTKPIAASQLNPVKPETPLITDVQPVESQMTTVQTDTNTQATTVTQLSTSTQTATISTTASTTQANTNTQTIIASTTQIDTNTQAITSITTTQPNANSQATAVSIVVATLPANNNLPPGIIKHAPLIFGDPRFIPNVKKDDPTNSPAQSPIQGLPAPSISLPSLLPQPVNSQQLEDAKKAAEDIAKAQQQALEDAKKAAEETAKAQQQALEDAKKAAEETAKAQQQALEDAKKATEETAKVHQQALQDVKETASDISQAVSNE